MYGMDEHGRMMNAWNAACAGGAPVVLATLVGVRGSSYRSLGARMLILEDGTRIGSLSGGCIEGELCRRAFWWTRDGRPYLRTYDTSLPQEEEDEGYGLGCGGSIDVWLERLPPGDPLNPLLLAEEVRTTRTHRITATVLRSTDEAMRGRRFAVSTFIAGALQIPTTRMAAAEESSRWVAGAADTGADASTDIFIDVMRPPTQLVICGAGFDAQPLVHLATQLGWQVVVCDGRSDFARPQRFPEAHQVLWIRRPDELPVSRFDAATACILMTHSFEQDRLFLEQILPLDLPYAGVLGSRDRTQTMLETLGTSIEESGIFAPAGLDIGAETPEEIAISIAAEIRARLANRSGGSLRDRSGPIHASARSPRAQASLLLDNTGLCKV